MSSSSPSSPAAGGPSHASSSSSHDANPPTFAAFSPTPLGHHSTTSLASSSTSSNRRSTVTLVHQKSPLLVATPAQITRALAQFHPFLGPLNALAGLLTWTTGDPWESFLLLAVFWAVALYGDVVLRWAGPLVAVVGLIAVLYLRRFSALSSTRWTGEKGNEQGKEKVGGGGSQRKTLDDIVETLKLFTSRCNILLDPLLQFTEYLSTQKTATSATTRPALTSLFIRILIITPVWIILTLPPLYIITTRRFVLTVGTLILSWHSRPARVSRTILWRSRTLRRLSSAITGLHFDASEPSATTPPKLPPRKDKGANEIAASLAAKRGLDSAGIRFTFTLYENQRRWLGLGWTPSMLTYERAPWTDEHLNPMPSKEEFELPDVDGGHARWRWVEGSEWQVDTGASEGGKARSETKRSRDAGGGAEWVYYDNKWRNGRRGQDGWGRYTRRRKWVRDAELVETTSSTEVSRSATPRPDSGLDQSVRSDAGSSLPSEPPPDYSTTMRGDAGGEGGGSGKERKKGWFRRTSVAGSQRSRNSSSVESVGVGGERDEGEGEELSSPLRQQVRDGGWGVGDEVRMQLG